MSFLLDTNILSEMRRGQRADANVRGWLAAHHHERFYVSVVSFGEIANGIARLRAKNDFQQAAMIEKLLNEELIPDCTGLMLEVTEAIALRWGSLCPHQEPAAPDGLLAATALEYDLTLVTRNVSDFVRTGVRLVNPFEP